MSFQDLFDFTGRTILVTGGSSGIGRAAAILLSELDAKIVLVARREEQLKETIALMKGDEHRYYVQDLKEIDAIEGLMKQIVLDNGILSGMAYCAGISSSRNVKMSNYEYVNNMMKINYFAFYELVRQLTKKGHYIENAKIVGISSIASTGFTKGQSVYAASKAAIEASVRIMGQEFISKKVNINVIKPGWVNTGMYAGFINRSEDAEETEKTVKCQQPLGVIEVRDVAYMIAYLLSPAAKFITGQSILMSGGMHII